MKPDGDTKGMPRDRKGYQIDLGDYVAFDYMVAQADGDHEDAWDIIWGVAEKDGINVIDDPLTGRENQTYDYPESAADMLIIKKVNISLEEIAKRYKSKNAKRCISKKTEASAIQSWKNKLGDSRG